MLKKSEKLLMNIMIYGETIIHIIILISGFKLRISNLRMIYNLYILYIRIELGLDLDPRVINKIIYIEIC